MSTIRNQSGRRLRQGVALLALALGSAAALAAGPPPPSYPERYAPPADAAERDARCAEYTERAGYSGSWLKDRNPLGHLDFVRKHHRQMERFRKEYCGEASTAGHELSHRAVARSDMPDIHHPDRTLQAAPGPVSHGGPVGHAAAHH